MLSPILLDACNPGPMTGRGNHTYLVIGVDQSAALVDAGVGDPGHLAALQAALDARSARLRAVLVTHGHPDHAAGAPALARLHGAACWKFPWPARDGSHPIRWVPMRDGQAIEAAGERLEVVHAPGHSPDHVVLWHEDSRTVFSGDLVIQGGSVMIDWAHGGDMIQYLQSLVRVRELRPRVLLPAHGPPISNPAELLSAYLDHRLARERQVLAALDAGLETLSAIAESIYHGLHEPLASAARGNVRAHLEKLKAEGRAVDADGRWRLVKPPAQD